MKKILLLTLAALLLSVSIDAQITPVNDDKAPVKAAPAPMTFEARYEGGMFGFSRREKGSLKFDDINKRIVFIDKDQKERFSLAYEALQVVTPNSRSVTSTTGNVIRHIPLPGAGLAGLIKEKRQYLVIQFSDPDFEVSGTVSFKLDSRELVDSVIQTLGEKAKMKQRGDAYYRPRPGSNEI